MMKAINNKDIPWKKAEILEMSSNPLWALFFIVIASFIMLFLYRFSRIV
jgi:hypothetical protein